MNKAILSLEAQADEHASDYVGSLRQRGVQVLPAYYEQAFRKKFAELIVRECAHRSARLRHVYPHQAALTATAILDHFGIKE
jgi:hypothetical protein